MALNVFVWHERFPVYENRMRAMGDAKWLEWVKTQAAKLSLEPKPEPTPARGFTEESSPPVLFKDWD